MQPPLFSARFVPLVAICLVALAVGACGRRGPLEAPGAGTKSADATRTAGSSPTTLATRPQAVTNDTAEDETADEDPAQSILPTPNPQPKGRRGRAYLVPKEPFILDPLL